MYYLFDNCVEFEDGQVYIDYYVIDDGINEYYDYWFQQVVQGIYGVVDFLFIVFGDFEQYGIQCVGFFVDGGYLDYYVWEQVDLFYCYVDWVVY